MITHEKTVISQYATPPIVLNMLDDFNANIDPSIDIENFLSNIWNLNTAAGFGLDIWGRIVGVERYIKISDTLDNFGFSQGGWQGFGQECFYSSGMLDGHLYRLEDPVYRSLIKVKAASNITACDAPSINSMLTKLFEGRGHAWVVDLGNMAMSIRFDFTLTDTDIALLEWSGAIHTPAGVQVYLDQDQGDVFGFSQAGLDGFSDAVHDVSQGPFTLGLIPCN